MHWQLPHMQHVVDIQGMEVPLDRACGPSRSWAQTMSVMHPFPCPIGVGQETVTTSQALVAGGITIGVLVAPTIWRGVKLVRDVVQCIKSVRNQATSKAIYGDGGIMNEWKFLRGDMSEGDGVTTDANAFQWINLGLWSGAWRGPCGRGVGVSVPAC